MATIEPGAEQFRRFAAGTDDTRPITMLNLLRYRAQADYSDHPQESPCSGAQAYRRYAEKALDCIAECGGKLVFAGPAAMTVIGPEDEQWDDVLLVEYPSRAAMIGMLESERYRAIVYHRSAALADSRLVPITGDGLTYLT